jgi:hypothetical protein
MWYRPLWRDAARTAAGISSRAGDRDHLASLRSRTWIMYNCCLRLTCAYHSATRSSPHILASPGTNRLGLIRLSVAETARLARLAADWPAWLRQPEPRRPDGGDSM